MTREEAIYELDNMKTWSEDLSDDEIEALAFALRAIGENEKLISELFDMQNKIADSIVYNAKLLQEIEDLKAIIKSNKATIQEQRELRTSLMQKNKKYKCLGEKIMAEYIDRNLIEWYGCNFEDASCENRECSGCSHAECSHSQVMQIPTADVVERSKIDKAINKLKQYSESFVYAGRRELVVTVDNCIDILKRIIGE